jgi:hypothetical protein
MCNQTSLVKLRGGPPMDSKISARSSKGVSYNVISSNFRRAESGIKRLCREVREGAILTSAAYQRYMDFTLAHLYVANPQARIGAIQAMTMAAFEMLESKGMVPSTSFKTERNYTFQYISACEASLRYSGTP